MRKKIAKLRVRFRIWYHWIRKREVFYNKEGNPIVKPEWVLRIGDRKHPIYSDPLIKYWIKVATRRDTPYPWVTSKQIRAGVLSRSTYYEYHTQGTIVLVELKRTFFGEESEKGTA